MKDLKISILAILLLVIGVSEASAQQDPLYSQYVFNPLAVNAAYAGSEGHLTATALSRHQWVGFDGAPSTQSLVVHAPLRKEEIGLGLSLVNDKLGPVSQLTMQGDFSYTMKVTGSANLSLGLKAGGSLLQADWADVALDQSNDAAFTQGSSSLFLPNFGFGAYYKHRKYYVGASLPKLMRNDLSGAGGKPVENAGEIRHFFLMGGYKHVIREGTELHPSIMLRKVKNAPTSLDISMNALLSEKFWVGIMYRWKNALGANVQYYINQQFRIGYAYDLTTTTLGQYNGGTHEIMLRFDLNKGAADDGSTEPTEVLPSGN